MNILDVLDQVEAASGTLAKTAILSKFSQDTQLRELTDICLNSQRRFWIKSFNANTPPLDTFKSRPTTYTDFLSLIHDLETRTITGNEALDATESFFELCTEQEQKWYSRILKRDFRIGVQVNTLNDCGFNIPTFEVQLATDAKKCKKLKDIVEKGVLVSPKLDGFRCLAVIEEGKVTLYSRNGCEITTQDAIEKALIKLFPKGNLVLDGELMGANLSDGFKAMQESAFASKRGSNSKLIHYNVFDYIPYNEWISGEFKTSAQERYWNLKHILGETEDSVIKLVKHIESKDLIEVLKAEYTCVERGYEGAMICPIDAPYYRGRKSNKMMKLKTMESQDCEIIGFTEGTGRNVGKLGSFKVKQENGALCEVGSGFTDEERESLWHNVYDNVNRIIEVKYQNLTPDGIMRFPVFKCFRDIKERKGEKI